MKQFIFLITFSQNQHKRSSIFLKVVSLSKKIDSDIILSSGKKYSGINKHKFDLNKAIVSQNNSREEKLIDGYKKIFPKKSYQGDIIKEFQHYIRTFFIIQKCYQGNINIYLC